MMLNGEVSSLAIDLARVHGRTVTSFYSNLVTRPTGRAIRMGVESQIAELRPRRTWFLSVLDFSQVRLIDYSCADEIVAKLLLRYASDDRPGDAYFVVRGLQDHHVDAIEAVLERHGLLLAAQNAAGDVRLMGPADPFERTCWSVLARRGQAKVGEIAADTGFGEDAVAATVHALKQHRVALDLGPGVCCAVPYLAAQ